MKACPNDAFPAGNTVLGQYLESLGVELSANDAGDVASDIPQLSLADPPVFAIAVASTDGRLYKAGAWDCEVTIQSVSKPFM